MKLEFRWLRSFSPSEGSIKQVEWGSSVYYELQYRTYADPKGCDIALVDPWGPWQKVQVVEERHGG